MGFISWIVVGLIAGWLAKRLMPGPEPGGLLMTLLIGVIGAVVGGWIFNFFGRAGATRIDFYSVVVATIGAIVFLWIWKALRRGRTA